MSLQTDFQGLTQSEVSRRIQQKQTNRTTARAGRSVGQIFVENIFTYFNLVFVVLAVILLFTGSSVKNMTFMVVVLINTAIGIFQQVRAKRAVDKLTLVTAQQVRVLRDGQWISLRSDLLVLDDVVEFGAGDQICADGVVLSGTMQVNEALLTGESDAVEKSQGSTVLCGSFAVNGRAVVRLTQVGDNAFAPKLAKEAKSDPRAAKSEMMNALDKLIRVVGLALIPVGCLLFYQEYHILSLGLKTSAQSTVAALVGMIPEGLYLLTSVAMAASALKLTRQKVLVQDLNCIETLARVDVLCVDKTGTITQPGMEVSQVVPLGDISPEEIFSILGGIYAQQSPDNDTARAMQAYFHGDGFPVCTRHIPFDSAFKWCGAELENMGSFLVGAPDRILLDGYETLRPQVEHYAGQGFRVLLLASSEEPLSPGKHPQTLTPVALITLHNPIRSNAAQTFSYFAQQGVTVKVISGDNPLTASRIAQQAGIAHGDLYVDASTLTTPEEITHAVQTYTVFGRVTPQMKKQLIQALKDRGHTVAMTGDGVNDVLAMKLSDCSISMGSGAQAANQVAQLVLTNSDFAAMPGIVGEGRRVINNIQRTASLFLVKNILSLGLALICLVTGWAYPFMPFHLSIISALTIGVPGFFLAMEPNYERVTGKFLPTVLKRALPGGLTNLIVVVLAQLIMKSFQLPLTDSATVCTAVLAIVGLMVLQQVSVPMDTFRKVLWIAMAVALLGSFLVLGVPFELTITNLNSLWVLLLAAVAAPTVFYTLKRLLALLEKTGKI